MTSVFSRVNFLKTFLYIGILMLSVATANARTARYEFVAMRGLTTCGYAETEWQMNLSKEFGSDFSVKSIYCGEDAWIFELSGKDPLKFLPPTVSIGDDFIGGPFRSIAECEGEIRKLNSYKKRMIYMMDGLVIAKIDPRRKRPNLPVKIETPC